MWLWTKENSYLEKLKALEKNYAEDSPEKRISAFRKILAKKFGWENLIAGKLRKKYLEKYPQLLSYNHLLFKNLFSQTIYKKNLHPEIEKILPQAKLIALKKKLEKDKEAIAVLSTFAVNYFYVLAYYLNDPKLANPNLFLDVFKKKNEQLKNHPDLRAYILTHAIIGESQFYSKGILRHKKIYLKMLAELENIINTNYFQLALDIKFEFLVCCKLCDYSSSLEKIILGEADRSLADNGNFLISRLNDSCGTMTRNILDAEHRNVLFIMANSQYKNSSKK